MHTAKIPGGLALTSMILSTCQYPHQNSTEITLPVELQPEHKCCAIIARQGELSALAALSVPFDSPVSSICGLPAMPRVVHRSDSLASSVFLFPFSIFNYIAQVRYNYTILSCSARGSNETVITHAAAGGACSGRRLRFR